MTHQATTRIRRLAFPLLLLTSLLGCSGVKEALEDCGKARGAIRGELGVNSGCSCRWHNGQSVVDIRLLATPTGDAVAVKTRVTTIVARAFRSKVDHVTVTF